MALKAVPTPHRLSYAISTKSNDFIYVCIDTFCLCCVGFVDKQFFVVFCKSAKFGFENGLCVSHQEKKVCFLIVLYWL